MINESIGWPSCYSIFGQVILSRVLLNCVVVIIQEHINQI